MFNPISAFFARFFRRQPVKGPLSHQEYLVGLETLWRPTAR
jgi:hypothetical protein